MTLEKKGRTDMVRPMNPRMANPLLRGLMLLALFWPSMQAADSHSASAQPPAGLAPARVPQFMLLGFDDNPNVDCMNWFLDHAAPLKNPPGSGQAATYDGAPVRAIFYSNTGYWTNPALVAVHRRAVEAGHELGNHTHNHPNGSAFPVEKWREEIAAELKTYADHGFARKDVIGFRTPFLAYNAATFEALVAEGFVYDTTLDEGNAASEDGTNFLWPYTLDEGGPTNRARFAEGNPKRVGDHPGLWEIPLNLFMVPADTDCERLGIKPGLRARIGANLKVAYGSGSGEPADRITSLDWNVLEAAKCDGPEFLAILKYTLDLRLAGNRAPFMVGAHTQLYPADKPDRRKAMEDFIAYALSKPGVRFVTGPQLLAWMRKPVALGLPTAAE